MLLATEAMPEMRLYVCHFPDVFQTDDFQDISNGPAVVVRKEDQRAMDATLGIKSSIYIRVKQIRTSSLHEVARLMESLHGLINEIQRQHSPELRSLQSTRSIEQAY